MTLHQSDICPTTLPRLSTLQQRPQLESHKQKGDKYLASRWITSDLSQTCRDDMAALALLDAACTPAGKWLPVTVNMDYIIICSDKNLHESISSSKGYWTLSDTWFLGPTRIHA